jgi:glucosamine--fructose-6-phosphate aminotransferase (isomerizing)
MPHPYQAYFEITGQSAAWRESVEVVSAAQEEIGAFFAAARPSEIIFTGCTSPYFIGESVALHWQSALGIPVRAVPCSELVQFPAVYHTNLPGQPVLVVISRSGKTTETLWAVDAFAQKFPGRLFAICCAPDSPLAQKVARAVYLPKGHEQSLAQTASFSAMLLAAQMIGAIISRDDQTLATLQAAPAICDRVLAQAEPIAQAIMEHKPYQNVFYLGAGPTLGIARDAQLKMMEMSLSDTMCYTFMESRHGPRSLITEDSLVIGLCTHAGLGLEANLLAEYTQQHGATTVAITPVAGWRSGNPTFSIPVSCDWGDHILGLPYSPVMQLLAYYRALAKGVNPDVSRNLTQHIAISTPDAPLSGRAAPAREDVLGAK